MKKIIFSVLIGSCFSVAHAAPLKKPDLNKIFSTSPSKNSLTKTLSRQEMGTTKGAFWFGNSGFWLFPQRNIFTNPYQPNFYCQNNNGSIFCF
jgi:hypothetical protein